jgi:Xaa-Pro dipeptidase
LYPPPSIAHDEYRTRQERVLQAARSDGADAVVAVSGPFYDRTGDVLYLTGHQPPFPSSAFDGAYRGLGFAAAVLTADGACHLVTDTTAYREERVAADSIRPTSNVTSELRRTLEELGLATGRLAFIGLEVAPYAFVQEATGSLAVDLVPADTVIRDLRRRKSPAEIELLRRAAGVAEIGMAAALDAIRPGVTESVVAGEGIRACMANGADFVRYLRVMSGPYSGWQHRWPPATERVMQEGETVCMDLIGAVNGYQFDILRAKVVGEHEPAMLKRMEVARAATEAAIAACGPGVPLRDVVAASDRVLEEAGELEHRARFTGHGIGLETVEAPLVMESSTGTLREGDVICLEPGILNRGAYGARFEYEVAITADGHDVLARD